MDEAGLKPNESMKTGIELITEERLRQISQEGWMPEHDDEHKSGELSKAGAIYADLAASQQCCACATEQEQRAYAMIQGWPWSNEWFKPSQDIVRNLAKAGALIAAEIDRLQRQNDQAHRLP